MEERIDYKKAYESKKRPEGVYLMIQFCSNIKNSTNIKDIPSILRLYYGRVVTCEQNEFVTEVLNNIVAKNPRDAARIIIDNIRILKEEHAEECFGDILLIFIYWNSQLKNIFMEEIKRANQENQKYIIDNIEYLAEEENDEEYIKFLHEYEKK